jgi:Sortase domain
VSRVPRWLLGTTAKVSLACLLGLAGAALIWVAFTGADPPDIPSSSSQDGPTRVSSSDPAHRSDLPASADGRRGGVPDPITGPVLPESDPIEVTIPRLGVRSRLVSLGVDEAGSMEVPQDPAVAGWYSLGPTPGSLGPAVIAGHVTWNSTPGVFFRLGTMRPGDRVTVSRADGGRAVFAVSRVATFEKSRFPTRRVFGDLGYAGLRLVTCGGTYDAQSHRYLHNVVVFARLVSVHRTAG